jgi:hypothetical protein
MRYAQDISVREMNLKRAEGDPISHRADVVNFHGARLSDNRASTSFQPEIYSAENLWLQTFPGHVRFSMKKRNQISDGKVSEHSRGLGTVTPEMVTQRAHEIALINRRPNDKPTPDDWQEAKRELTTGETRHDPTEDVPVSKRWDPVPGSIPRKAEAVPADDEQTFAEQLVEGGVEEAEHEHMVEGTRESVRRDRELGESGT